MKTITIKVDDKYAGVISATFIGSGQLKTYVSIISENIHDNMVIAIDDKGIAGKINTIGIAKTEDKQDD